MKLAGNRSYSPVCAYGNHDCDGKTPWTDIPITFRLLCGCECHDEYDEDGNRR